LPYSRRPMAPPPSGSPPRWLLALALLPCLGYLAAELYFLDGRLGFPLDDSWIHLVFARNLAAGAPFSFQGGELVAGSTAPLWSALLSLAFLAPGPPLPWVKVLGIGWHLAAVAAVAGLARELGGSRGAAALAGAFAATTSWLVWGALSGMEIPCFAALSAWGMVLQSRERRDPMRRPLALLLFALATLVRPEGALLLALAVGDRLLRVRRQGEALALARPAWRPLLAGLGLAALVLLPVLLFYLAIGGDPLPTTFSTKAGYAAPGLPRLRYLYVVFGIVFQAQPVVALLAAAGALSLVARLGGEDDRGLLPGLWLLALPLAYGVLSAHQRSPLVGNFGRYLFPLFPVAAALAVLPLQAAAAALPSRLALGGRSFAWKAAAAVLLLLPSLPPLARGGGRYVQSVLNVEQSDVRMARLLSAVLPPEAVLAVNDIGAFGYHLPNRLIDLAGIVTPEVHDWARRSVAETGNWRPGVHAFVEHTRPDYLAVFPAWFGGLLDRPGYTPLLRLRVADNITMGGDELVLYATPWTRAPLRRPLREPPS
ncbi:MAG TPA: hypothetical protein VMT16_15350, partial [Thermoanaerobaculia bacterium]|nr:hypothetical protein [Thermoanaerobaculia bacterium]